MGKRGPAPAGECVVKPEWLDDLGSAEWDKVAPELIEIGRLTALDTTALGAYCMAYSTFRRAQRELDKGLLHKTESGIIRQSPYMSIASTAYEQLRKYAREFGLTPAARDGRILKPDAEAAHGAETDLSSLSADTGSKQH
jgi:P27 family predicted phage terminase small subunit